MFCDHRCLFLIHGPACRSKDSRQRMGLDAEVAERGAGANAHTHTDSDAHTHTDAGSDTDADAGAGYQSHADTHTPAHAAYARDQ